MFQTFGSYIFLIVIIIKQIFSPNMVRFSNKQISSKQKKSSFLCLSTDYQLSNLSRFSQKHQNSTFSTLFEILPFFNKGGQKKVDTLITRLTNVNYEDKLSTKPWKSFKILWKLEIILSIFKFDDLSNKREQCVKRAWKILKGMKNCFVQQTVWSNAKII